METKTTTWNVDPTHSEILFKVKHLVISTVTGSFKKFEGKIETNSREEFDGAEVTFHLDTNTVDTNMKDRDTHLKSQEFFHSEKFPKLSFSGKMKKESGDKYKLAGTMTIKDTKKEVEFVAEYGGTAVDGYSQTKAGFEITGAINRKEFGLTWDMVTETGSIVVSNQVKLQLNIQLVKS